MRILTVRQPWAWAIIHGGKNVENRSRNIAGDYRGPIAVHVGLEDADNAPGKLWLDSANFYRKRSGVPFSRFSWRDTNRGLIIGVVDLVDVHFNGTRSERWDAENQQNATCSPWAEHGDLYHLVLANSRPLAEPIPYRGALGLREVPADLLARIEAAL